MSLVSVADALAAVVFVAVIVATGFVFLRKKDGPCCPHCAASGRASCYELEGVSAFGDVVERCRYCETREVFAVRGSKVEMLKFTAEEWRSLRGKVPTKGFRAAHKVAARARRVRGTPPEREASGGEWE